MQTSACSNTDQKTTSSDLPQPLLQLLPRIRANGYWHYLQWRLERPSISRESKESEQEVYVTNYGTKERSPDLPMPQVIDFLVELSGIEPLVSSL